MLGRACPANDFKGERSAEQEAIPMWPAILPVQHGFESAGVMLGVSAGKTRGRAGFEPVIRG
jgi:hypothetical protein